MATGGDFLVATDGDFLMAMDTAGQRVGVLPHRLYPLV